MRILLYALFLCLACTGGARRFTSLCQCLLVWSFWFFLPPSCALTRTAPQRQTFSAPVGVCSLLSTLCFCFPRGGSPGVFSPHCGARRIACCGSLRKFGSLKCLLLPPFSALWFLVCTAARLESPFAPVPASLVLLCYRDNVHMPTIFSTCAHSPDSCRNVLGNRQVLDILNANFVCWGWDVTTPLYVL